MYNSIIFTIVLKEIQKMCIVTFLNDAVNFFPICNKVMCKASPDNSLKVFNREMNITKNYFAL